MEEKIIKLTDIIVNYSLRVKENDRVMIVYQNNESKKLVECLIKKIFEEKGIPFVKMIDPTLSSILTEHTNGKRIEEIKKHSQFEVDNYDCFISIIYTYNDYENKNIDSKIRRMISKATEKIDDIRINQRRWVLLKYPSVLDAYKAKMPVNKFVDFSFEVMNVDYEDMYEKVKPLKELMEKTDKVRIVSPNTDLTFSIKDIPSIPCCGKYNIPDGEIYTAPVKNSVNGVITYNTPSPYQGNIYNNVKLVFKDGKIIEATSDNDVDKLIKILDTDEGSRYIGEFAIGLNPKIMHPMGDILYDEKIIGSIHFTPGRAYKEAYNGNESGVHWDMVLIQRKEYGGGEIYFDDVLIRKDGIFILPELKHLNYNLEIS